MNAGAARACRADRRLAKLKDSSVPRSFKRGWEALPHRARGRLRRRWREAQKALAGYGGLKQIQHLNKLALAADKQWFRYEGNLLPIREVSGE